MTRTSRAVVSFQGELGAFSEDAVMNVFDRNATDLLPRPDCFAAAGAVLDGSADFAVLPMENTLAGSVSEAYDALCGSEQLVVFAETTVAIDQCLLAVPGATLADINVAYSHRIALAQCRGFFAANPHVVAAPAYDTAGAARDVSARGSHNEAAIAGRTAARRYGLNVLLERIQDRRDNQTRFWAMTRRERIFPRNLPVSEQLTLLSAQAASRDAQSSAHSIRVILRAGPYTASDRRMQQSLACMDELGLPVAHLEARPAPTPWQHYYVMECHCTGEPEQLRLALTSLDQLEVRLAGIVSASIPSPTVLNDADAA